MPVEFVIRDVLTSIITGVVILGVVFSPIGRAFAHRIMHGKAPRQPELADHTPAASTSVAIGRTLSPITTSPMKRATGM